MKCKSEQGAIKTTFLQMNKKGITDFVESMVINRGSQPAYVLLSHEFWIYLKPPSETLEIPFPPLLLLPLIIVITIDTVIK